MNAYFDNDMWSQDRATFEDELEYFVNKNLPVHDCVSDETLDEWLERMNDRPYPKRTKGTNPFDYVVNHSGILVDPFDSETIMDPSVLKMMNERNNK